MANSIDFILTTAADKLISKVLAGKTLNFTRMTVGDGFSYDINIAKGFKSLVNEVLSLDIIKKETLSPKSVRVTSAFKNTDAQKEFYYREVGLYAQDPDTGEEVLYAYGNRNDAAELIKPTGSNVITKQLAFIISVGNSANVTLNVNAGVYALQEDITTLQADLDKLNSTKADKTMIGTPLTANTIASMKDTSKVYVYTGSENGYTSGNWYYYNGTTWTSGGVYNSIAIGDKTVKNKHTAFKAITMPYQVVTSQGFIGSTNNNDSSRRKSDVLLVSKGDKFINELPDTYSFYLSSTDSSGNFIAPLTSTWATLSEYEFQSDGYVVVNFRKTTPTSAAFTASEISILEDSAYIKYLSSPTSKREVLKMLDMVYYVSPDGNDSNDGLSSTTPLASFSKAISMGAKKIYARRGNYYNQTITVSNMDSFSVLPYGSTTYSQNIPNRPLINIYNATDISTSYDSNTGLQKASFTTITTSSIYKVFVSKEMNPVIDASARIPKYNTNCWQRGNTIDLDLRLLPVLTLEECKNTIGSFFYDGAYIYINPFSSVFSKFTIQNDNDYIINITNCKNVILEDVQAEFSTKQVAKITDCYNVNLTNCKFGYASQTDNVQLDNTNGMLKKCKSYRASNDGFNIHSYGETTLIDCEALYCYDDGISHHEGGTGTIIGGLYKGNGKGGISPTYGAIVNIYNAVVEKNKYGIYYRGSEGDTIRDVLLSNVLIKENTFAYSANEYYNISAWGNKLYSNTTEKESTSKTIVFM